MRKYVVVALLSFLATLGVAAFLLTPESRPAVDTLLAYKQGLGVYAPIPQTSSEVSSSVESACAFLSSRASVTFSQQFKDRLVSLETASLTSSKPDLEQVVEIISSQLLETASSVSDEEIDSMVPVWKTLPDFTPENRALYVNLTASGQGISDAEFPAIAREFRDGQTPQSQQWRAAFPAQVQDAIKARTELYADALPSQWGRDHYSPLQVILLAYALVSDDYFDGDLTYLITVMQANADWLQSDYSISAPIEGRKAFGVNGYIHSTPLNILFTEQVAGRILDRVDEVLQ